MKPSTARRALEIVEDALELPISDQHHFVDQHCGDDAELRREVEAMLTLDRGIRIDTPEIADAVHQNPPSVVDPDQRYELQEEIGCGGMGTVYRAFDYELQREVAVKVMRSGGMPSGEMELRFATEAQITAKLQHPGVAPVYDRGVLSDGQSFFAMKLVRGETLSSLISSREDPHVDRERLLAVFEQLCQTIAYAHSRGIIHRDLKPDNVMVGEFGEVQVMDWGLAKFVDGENEQQVDEPSPDESDRPRIRSGSPTETRIGMVVGTPAYMPPEQAAGRRGKPTDVFSLGAILCEIVTGKPPYTARSSAEIYKKSVAADLDDAFARLDESDADSEIVSLAKQCLQADSKDRPEDAGHVSHRLSQHLQAVQSRLREAEIARAQAETKTQEQQKRMRFVAALVGLSLILVTVVLATWSFNSLQRARHADELTAMESEKSSTLQSQVYRLQMATAFGEFQSENYQRALQVLETASPEARNWEWDYLRSQLDQSLRLFSLPKRPISCAIVRDHDRILALDDQNVAHVWDRASGIQVSTHSVKGMPIAVAPDGHRILSYDGHPVIWDGLTGEVLHEFSGWPKPQGRGLTLLRTAAISTGGKHVSFRANNRLLLFDGKTGKKLHDFKTKRLLSVVFSPDGRWLVWTDQNRIHFWDIETNEPAREPIQYSSVADPGSLAVSDDSSMVAVSFLEHVVVWNLMTDERQTLSVDTHTTALTDAFVCFTDLGSKLITVSSNDAVRVWDSRKGTLLRTLRLSPAKIATLGAVNYHDGHLALPCADGVRLWCVRDQSPLVLEGHTGFVYPVAISPDGSQIASGGWDQTIRVWNAETGKPTWVSHDDSGFILDLVFDQQGRRVISGSAGGDVSVWDASDGTQLQQATVGGKVTGVRSTTDGHVLIVHGGISLLDGSSLEVINRFTGKQQTGLCVSSDGSRFLTWGESEIVGRTLSLWDLNQPKPVAQFIARHPVTSAAFTKDGKQIFTGDREGNIAIWEVDSLQRPIVEIKAHSREVFSLRFLPDESRLISAGRDAVIRIWDVASGDAVGLLRGHDDYVYSLAVSPDGRRIISGSGDNTVRIWEADPLRKRLQAISTEDFARRRTESAAD